MSDEEIEVFISYDHATHFDSVLAVFSKLKQSMMTQYETQFKLA